MKAMNITVKDLEFKDTVELGRLQKNDKFIYYGNKAGIVLENNEECNSVMTIEFDNDGNIIKGMFSRAFGVIPATFDLTVRNMDPIEFEEILANREVKTG